MTDPARADPVDETRLSVLARRLAAEMIAASQVCRRAEDLAAGLAAEGGAALDQLSPLQSLDELTQRLSNLAVVLDGVADQAEADWTLDIAPLLAQVRLGDLAQRLAGAPAAKPVTGEADIF